MYNYFFKPVLDVVLSLTALIIFGPIIAIVALLVRINLGSPIFFTQERPGLHGKPFIMFKFRTMTDARDRNGNLLSDANRLTSFGRFLRSTSLDELPGLINVLRGEMSLVGPRPLLPRYLGRYNQEAYRRHEVLPGITGWAQVNGRNTVSWEKRFEMDVWYIDHQSLQLDLKIILMTITKVFKRDGISQAGQATMAEFRG